MTPRTLRFLDLRSPVRILKFPVRAVPIVHLLAAGIAILSSGGFSRPPSRALELPQSFELTVSEIRDETFHDAKTDSIVTRRFVWSLTHCGRIEGAAVRSDGATESGRRRETKSEVYSVYTDSLLFRSDAPFRFTGRIRRDTVIVASLEKGPSTKTEMLDADKEMLACLFEGPSILVRVSDENRPEEIKDLKAHCAGGLYRRLNLPVTFGVFVLPLQSGRDHAETRWKMERVLPSFSGLGLAPRLNLVFETVEGTGVKGTPEEIEIACDSTLANVSTVTPAGQTIDVISDRMRVRGTLRPWHGMPWVRAGELQMEENIHYTRPGLESPVLEKRSRVEILLEPR